MVPAYTIFIYTAIEAHCILNSPDKTFIYRISIIIYFCYLQAQNYVKKIEDLKKKKKSSHKYVF